MENEAAAVRSPGRLSRMSTSKSLRSARGGYGLLDSAERKDSELDRDSRAMMEDARKRVFRLVGIKNRFRLAPSSLCARIFERLLCVAGVRSGVTKC